jgi:zinc transporter, ZIP family
VRWLVAGLLLGAGIGAAAVVLLARGDSVQTSAPAEEQGFAVLRSSLQPGMITLLARNDGEEPVRIAQVLVNDAYVDFHAQLLTVAPSHETQVMVHYPWLAGESYEIGLLTATGRIVEYELEDAGET